MEDYFPYRNVFEESDICPVIFSVAKKEQPYIEEWVKWHIALGFDHIYLYDNEDTPVYKNQLIKYEKFLTVMYLPGNNHYKAVQYIAIDDFIINHMYRKYKTHAIHLDIDEFIVLKQHNNIKDFIKQFFIEDCGAIGINWRFFGDSGLNIESEKPVVSRFTKRQKFGDHHIKTLFDTSFFRSYNTVHDINLVFPYKTKNTKNDIIVGPFNSNQDYEYIQINHYKSKTFSEFQKYCLRGRADIVVRHQPPVNYEQIFNMYNLNEEEDLTALNYLNFVEKFWSEQKI